MPIIQQHTLGKPIKMHTKPLERTPEGRLVINEKAKLYGHKWRKARIIFLRRNPLCVECMKAERVESATEVDHIVPHKGNMQLFWDKTNWQALCKPHHSEKTARENGGFGNRI